MSVVSVSETRARKGALKARNGCSPAASVITLKTPARRVEAERRSISSVFASPGPS